MRWAVSHIDWMDHELTTVILEGRDWKQALAGHPKMSSPDMQEWLKEMPDDQDQAKQYAFNADSMIEVVPITD